MAIPAKLSGKSIKTVPFDNDTGTINLFAVTGTVVVSLVCVCMSGVASGLGGSISVGVSGATAVLIPLTLATDIDADDIWHDGTPDIKIELSSVAAEYIIANSYDIFMTLSAQIDSGRLEFYCNWAPLSANGLVTPA